MNFTREMSEAIEINRQLDEKFPTQGGEHIMTVLMMALAMRYRKDHPTNDGTYKGWADTTREALLDYPEGGDYETVAAQLALEAH